ncbi:MAG: hypothetical protein AB1607_06635 [Chloroflexota bacterium]
MQTNYRFSRIVNVTFFISLITISCATQSADATPTVDMVGTLSIELAWVMQTQTAGASTPTPLPPTETATASFTDTPASPPTETQQPRPPAVVVFAGCYTGPGENYTLISNIDPSIRESGRQRVTILGIGSEPGWVVIRNPYFNNPCWIELKNLEIDPGYDLTQFPAMTSGAP